MTESATFPTEPTSVTSRQEVPWSREDVQRVLFNVVKCYEQAHEHTYTEVSGGKRTRKWRPTPVLGGDSEFLRDAIRIAKLTLKENDWWPVDDR